MFVDVVENFSEIDRAGFSNISLNNESIHDVVIEFCPKLEDNVYLFF